MLFDELVYLMACQVCAGRPATEPARAAAWRSSVAATFEAAKWD